MSIEIKSSGGSYLVHLDDSEMAESVLSDPKHIFVIDRLVWKLYKSTLLRSIDPSRIVLIDALERNKEYSRLARVYKLVLAMGAQKNTILVAIGGGIIQDIVAFVAATLFRGIPWFFFPTSLLAQADSCIGAKASINFQDAKNQIGAFYPPRSVHILSVFLGTLERSAQKSGLGEIAKLSIIDGETRWRDFAAGIGELLKGNDQALVSWIGIALSIKKRFIEEDEFDRGIRNHLNYGHCFGHAIETVTRNRIPHGQAVTHGICLADLLAVRRGKLSFETAEERRRILGPLVDVALGGLDLSASRMLLAMKKDKKRNGPGYSVIVSEQSYRMSKLDDVQAEEIEEVLRLNKS